MKFLLTVSTPPRYKEFKDHLRSKSSSGLRSGSSSKAIETADATAVPSRCMIVSYVVLREGIGRQTLTILSMQRSYGTFTDRSTTAFHSAASRLKLAPGNHAGMYRTKRER